MNMLYFELNGCGTGNIAMATKFFDIFDCLKFLQLNANFYLILIHDSLILVLLDI